jgi:predicted RND superfamily exporter protein
LLKKISILTLIGISLITAVFIYALTSIQFDYDFEKFFPESDPDTEYFNEYRKKFETDNDFVLIGIVNKKGIYQKDFLIKVDSLTHQLAKLKNITNSVSITNYEEPIFVDFTGSFMLKKMVHPATDSLMKVDSARIAKSKTLINSLVSENGKSLTIFLKTKPYLSKAGSDSLANDLTVLLDEYSFDELHVAGRSTGQSYYVKLMQSELLFFLITSLLLVVVFLALSFRTVWGVVFPVIVVLLSIIWTIGVMAVQGEGISLVQTVLPTILFVVGMSDSVHIISKYIEELREGKEKFRALKDSFKDVAMATFLTSFTTAVGFITLMFVPIEPVREFGLYTSIGITFAYVLSFTLLPAILILMPAPKISLKKEEDTIWPKFLSNLYLWLIRNRKRVMISFSATIIFSGVACTQLSFNNYLVEDLKESDPMKQNFYFFEKNFAGVRPFELGLELKDKTKSGLSLEVLKEIEKIENYLEKEYGTGFVLSPLTIIKNLNKAMHTGAEEYYKLPENEKELSKLIKKIKKYDSKKIMGTVITSDNQTIRISGKTADLGSAIFREKNKELDEFMAKDNRAELFEYKLTGTAVLIDKNNVYLASNLIYGLLISALIISLITALMFNFSLKMVIISLLPNILPIFFIGAIMAAAGINLKVSTSMIFSISFGIAVDDTIHFLSRLRIELSKGKSLMYAMKRTYLSTGKAIILTTIILSGGFMTLIFSSFLGTFYVGFLIGLTLIFAVICDMLYLPVLLWFFKAKKVKNAS